MSKHMQDKGWPALTDAAVTSILDRWDAAVAFAHFSWSGPCLRAVTRLLATRDYGRMTEAQWFATQAGLLVYGARTPVTPLPTSPATPEDRAAFVKAADAWRATPPGVRHMHAVANLLERGGLEQFWATMQVWEAGYQEDTQARLVKLGFNPKGRPDDQVLVPVPISHKSGATTLHGHFTHRDLFPKILKADQKPVTPFFADKK